MKNNSNNYEILNIGNSKTVELMVFINTLEDILKKNAKKNFIDMQAGDVKETFADILKIGAYGFLPIVEIEKGLEEFTKWYMSYE